MALKGIWEVLGEDNQSLARQISSQGEEGLLSVRETQHNLEVKEP